MKRISTLAPALLIVGLLTFGCGQISGPQAEASQEQRAEASTAAEACHNLPDDNCESGAGHNTSDED